MSRTTLLIWLLLSACPLFAGQKVGLVLGGGGAKGGAHIGVLQVLEELRVPVHCVVGTSAGALVGAMYASGLPAAEIHDRVTAIDWSTTVGSKDKRRHQPIEQKIAVPTYSNSMEFGVSWRGLRTPGGLIESQGIEEKLRALVAHARSEAHFDDLPIPFRAVATDMVAGEPVILSEGDLSVAMRASMAIPGVFSPVEAGETLLADGGMMNNLPVDVARETCADVVIAVWFHDPPPSTESMQSALGSVGRSINIMINRNQNLQIETLGGDDVGIQVEVEGIGTTDFQATADAIDFGRDAAQTHREALARLAVPEADYLVWRESLGTTIWREPVLADVRITGTERVNAAHIRGQLKLEPGTPLTLAVIDTTVDRINRLGDFSSISYSIAGEGDERSLVLELEEKPWGPDFARLDMGLGTTDDEISANLRVDHYRSWVNRMGGKWHNALQFGRLSLFTTDFYQPLETSQTLFMHWSGYIDRDLQDVYSDHDRIAQILVREQYLQADLGLNLAHHSQLRLGVRSGTNLAKVRTGPPQVPDSEQEADTSVQVRLVVDTRDDLSLPTSGTFINARYVDAQDWFGGSFEYSLVEAALEQAMSFKSNSLRLHVGYGEEITGDLPVTQDFQLGGIRSFPGLRPGELRGDRYWVGGLSYSWKLLDIQPLFGQAVYAGLRVQSGEMKDRIDGVEDTLNGISASLSGRTPVGPFELSLGYVIDKGGRLQFTLGRPLPEGSILDEVR